MGYQLVSEQSHTWLILNASVAIPLEGGELSEEDRDWLYTEYVVTPDDYRRLDTGQLVDRPDWMEREIRSLSELPPYEGGIRVQTHGSYPSTTRRGEHFVRYSAYGFDRRIRSDGGVYRGTYATTVTDLPLVPSGLAAVARYALPNPAPAIFEYQIVPPAGTVIHCGTCEPKHHQAGGGVEIKFDAQLPRGSAFGAAVIPER